jgi:hypothetical protein
MKIHFARSIDFFPFDNFLILSLSLLVYSSSTSLLAPLDDAAAQNER